ncbi:hypothetical protein [Manganibacter manganicus]|uniref:Uncharacterized protein n=1 Tax=Manganibacter manganicus TaxID=1873176 RepID=A0A1V8RN55_9HYPH|nr:hypothetical protein BFN67_20850 [Pseudaminobacter manganicus]
MDRAGAGRSKHRKGAGQGRLQFFHFPDRVAEGGELLHELPLIGQFMQIAFPRIHIAQRIDARNH